ncbi:hypothetical protein L1887_25341 [Cichorium endivia]|nr:hypothetical protein L1887_25341 [Cichorium endivia]
METMFAFKNSYSLRFLESNLTYYTDLISFFFTPLDPFQFQILRDYFLRQPSMSNPVIHVKILEYNNSIYELRVLLIKQWQKQLEIVSCALGNQRYLGEAQFRRAKKALIELTIGMVDDKHSSSGFACFVNELCDSFKFPLTEEQEAEYLHCGPKHDNLFLAHGIHGPGITNAGKLAERQGFMFHFHL